MTKACRWSINRRLYCVSGEVKKSLLSFDLSAISDPSSSAARQIKSSVPSSINKLILLIDCLRASRYYCLVEQPNINSSKYSFRRQRNGNQIKMEKWIRNEKCGAKSLSGLNVTSCHSILFSFFRLSLTPWKIVFRMQSDNNKFSFGNTMPWHLGGTTSGWRMSPNSDCQ